MQNNSRFYSLVIRIGNHMVILQDDLAFSYKVKSILLYDPTIVFLGIYQLDLCHEILTIQILNTNVYNICIHIWQKPRCISTGKWVSKLYLFNTVECYLVIIIMNHQVSQKYDTFLTIITKKAKKACWKDYNRNLKRLQYISIYMTLGKGQTIKTADQWWPGVEDSHGWQENRWRTGFFRIL